jgi:hypothetical protein
LVGRVGGKPAAGLVVALAVGTLLATNRVFGPFFPEQPPHSVLNMLRSDVDGSDVEASEVQRANGFR